MKLIKNAALLVYDGRGNCRAFVCVCRRRSRRESGQLARHDVLRDQLPSLRRNPVLISRARMSAAFFRDRATGIRNQLDRLNSALKEAQDLANRAAERMAHLEQDAAQLKAEMENETAFLVNRIREGARSYRRAHSARYRTHQRRDRRSRAAPRARTARRQRRQYRARADREKLRGLRPGAPHRQLHGQDSQRGRQ